MAKYRKKPVVVEAEIYKPGMEDGFHSYNLAGIYLGYFRKGEPIPRANNVPVMLTRQGKVAISEGDYIITQADGERYPCHPVNFEQTYEPVEGE